MCTVPEEVSKNVTGNGNPSLDNWPAGVPIPSWVDPANPDHVAQCGDLLLPVCCWPGCPKKIWTKHPEQPLCEAHIIITAQTYRDHYAVSDKPKPLPAERDGLIYYLQIGQHVKIGWTSSLETRLQSYPVTAVLLAAQPGTLADEQAMHAELKPHLAAGQEWYHDTQEIRALIDQALSTYGRCWETRRTKASRPWRGSGKVRLRS